MLPIPETSESLLLRVRDPKDQAAWCKFDAIYRPVVYRVARRQGWQDSDAQDLAQRVMVSVAKAIPDWERDATKGGFRCWLYQVARNALISTLRQDQRGFAVGGSAFHNQARSLEDPSDELERMIDQEHHRSTLRLAAEQIQSEFKKNTWQAFWLTTLQEHSIENAAQTLNMSVGAVYAARSRIMRRLQEVAQISNSDERELTHE